MQKAPKHPQDPKIRTKRRMRDTHFLIMIKTRVKKAPNNREKNRELIKLNKWLMKAMSLSNNNSSSSSNRKLLKKKSSSSNSSIKGFKSVISIKCRMKLENMMTKMILNLSPKLEQRKSRIHGV